MDARIKLVRARGIAVPGNDVDTDRIMPARYLKCVTFENLGQYVFQDERFDQSGKPREHPFNEPRHNGAGVLIVNKNFGCGSSREHAPQGILRAGIRAIIGESFAEIFAGNCTAIGLPAVVAPEPEITRLMQDVQRDPKIEIVVDLEKKQVSCGDRSFPVEIRESSRKMFLEGTWDSTATLLSAKSAIDQTASKIPYVQWVKKNGAETKKAARG